MTADEKNNLLKILNELNDSCGDTIGRDGEHLDSRVNWLIGLVKPMKTEDWSTSFTLAEMRDAFIFGAKEMKKNPGASDHIIDRASDAYSKLVQLSKNPNAVDILKLGYE